MRPTLAVVSAFLLALAIAACTKAPPADAAQDAAAPVVADAAPAPAQATSACPPAPTHDAGGNPLPRPQWTTDSPVGVTAHFYEKVLVGNADGGAPDRFQLEAWKPYLTRALADALAFAAASRDAAAAAAPDEKPSYAEGALFVSLFEGYTSAQPITVAMEGERASVPVCFRYESEGQVSEWADTVKLVREGGAWRIDDVVYGGQWDFANTGSLRRSLPAQK